MILPNKYVSLSDSFFGISALLLDTIGTNTLTIDIVWIKFKKKYIDTKKINSAPTYQKFIHVLEFMYLTNMINYTDKGEIFNENTKS